MLGKFDQIIEMLTKSGSRPLAVAERNRCEVQEQQINLMKNKVESQMEGYLKEKGMKREARTTNYVSNIRDMISQMQQTAVTTKTSVKTTAKVTTTN